jgi:hypothetical protein
VRPADSRYSDPPHASGPYRRAVGPPPFQPAAAPPAPAQPTNGFGSPPPGPEAPADGSDRAIPKAASAKLEQIKDLYLTAEAIGEDALDKHFDQVSQRQRELIQEFFDRSRPAGGEPR